MAESVDVKFEAQHEVLAGRFIRQHSSSTPDILFLHGGGKATKERSLPLAERLLREYELSSFIFDFSGHGQSTGLMPNSSLAKRVDEAMAAIDYAQFREPIAICAFSMGAHVALELLKLKNVHSLILFYPAVYARSAFPLRFGNPQFSSILRSDRSWESNDVLPALQRFSGNILIISGENDRVIPHAVLDMLYRATANAKRSTLIIVPKAPHLLLPSLFANEPLYTEISKTVADYVRTGRSYFASNVSAST